LLDSNVQIVPFYGHSPKAGRYACFSNFYLQHKSYKFEVPKEFCKAPLKESERMVDCNFSEKAIMLCKAAAMGDAVTYKKIAEAKDPKDAKALGRKVKGFDDAVWQKIVCSVAFQVIHQKFLNPELARILKETSGKVIAEATANDRNWGIGLNMGDPRVQKPSLWQGTNVLGWALMETRDALIEAERKRLQAAPTDVPAIIVDDPGDDEPTAKRRRCS